MTKALKEAIGYRIMTSKEELRRQVIEIWRAALASRLKVDSFRSLDDFLNIEITFEEACKKIKEELHSKYLMHESAFEQGHVKVAILISEGSARDLLRHRHISPLARSTRYQDPLYYETEGGLKLTTIWPPIIDANEEILLPNGQRLTPAQIDETYMNIYNGVKNHATKIYNSIKNPIGNINDACRQNRIFGNIMLVVIDGNFHGWRPVFKERLDKNTIYEIRMVLGPLVEELQTLVPVIFDDFVKAGVDEYGAPYYMQVPSVEEMKYKLEAFSLKATQKQWKELMDYIQAKIA